MPLLVAYQNSFIYLPVKVATDFYYLSYGVHIEAVTLPQSFNDCVPYSTGLGATFD